MRQTREFQCEIIANVPSSGANHTDPCPNSHPPKRHVDTADNPNNLTAKPNDHSTPIRRRSTHSPVRAQVPRFPPVAAAVLP